MTNRFIYLLMACLVLVSCNKSVSVNEEYFIVSQITPVEETKGYADLFNSGVEDFYIDFLPSFYGYRGTSSGAPFTVKIGASKTGQVDLIIEKISFYPVDSDKAYMTIGENLVVPLGQTDFELILTEDFSYSTDFIVRVSFLKKVSDVDEITVVYKVVRKYQERVIKIPLISA